MPQDEETDIRIPSDPTGNPTTSDRILSESVGILFTGIRQDIVGCRIRQIPTVGTCRIRQSEIIGKCRIRQKFYSAPDIHTCSANPIYRYKDNKYNLYQIHLKLRNKLLNKILYLPGIIDNRMNIYSKKLFSNDYYLS